MHKRNHTSVKSARRELVMAGYVTAFVPPGEPEKWRQPKKRGQRHDGREWAILQETRQRSERWSIVPYPPRGVTA